VHPNLLAAEGWIELGSYDEAAEELHNCPPDVKSSVSFVKLWVRIFAAKGRWVEVEQYCELLAKHAPDDPFTIMNQAEAFHRQGRSREAFAVFQMAPVSMKMGPEYFYAIARVLCALEQYTLALTCVGKAVDLDETFRMKALTDPDLERVWVDLQEG
jgi:tetratricopeptide (TPR) repeat protein